MALYKLMNVGMLSMGIDYILRDAKYALDIADMIGILCRQSDWSFIQKMLRNRPNDAFNILTIFFEDYTIVHKDQLRKQHPQMNEKEINVQFQNNLDSIRNQKSSTTFEHALILTPRSIEKSDKSGVSEAGTSHYDPREKKRESNLVAMGQFAVRKHSAADDGSSSRIYLSNL